MFLVSVPQISNAESFTDKNITGVFKEGSSYEKINCYRIGNKIYINGVNEATIIENTLSNNITYNKIKDENMFRTGWMYTETCPFGTPFDYTNYLTAKNKNVS